MKTLRHAFTVTSALAFVALAACASTSLVGCSQSTEDTASSSGAALSSAISSQVLDAVPNAAASDYHFATQTFRLFGTTPNADGGGFATFADKSTWATRHVAVGDYLSRNYQVASITKSGVTLRSASGTTSLKTGKETTINALYHRFDTASSYQGKNVWTVDGKTFADIHAAYGAGATADERTGTGPTAAIGTLTTVVLSNVDANGVLAHAGLQEGSVLVALNGTQLHKGDLDTVATALTKSGTKVSLTVSEHGAQHTVTYNVD
jgi:S1-C subfamily serine protease